MARRYFELIDDMDPSDRWLLGDPLDAQGREVRARPFMSGAPAQVDGPLRVPIHHPGRALDFSTVTTGGFPVVTQKVARILAELAPEDVQLIAVTVESRPESYFLVNVTRIVKCIDDAACTDVVYWKPEDGRPERVGQYRGVLGLRIQPSQVTGARVFRPWGWTVALIVSEDVRQALEHTGATGLDFRDVTGPLAT